MFPRTCSLRLALTLLVLVAVLPALGVILQSGFEAREQALREAEASALLLADSAAEIQERSAQGIEQLALVLAQSAQLRPPLLAQASGFLKSLAGVNPILSNIFVADRDGMLVASALPFNVLSVGDRDYFKAALGSSGLVAGEYQMGRVTNAPSFAFALPLQDRGEQPWGVLGISVNLQAYARIFEKANLPKESVLSIADRNGIRICRFPAAEAVPLGEPLPDLMWALASGPKERGTFLQTGQDGVKRIYAFAQLRLAPQEKPYLYIIIGIPQAEGTAQADAALRRNLFLLLAALAAALAAAQFVGRSLFGRRIDTLVSTAERLGRGDLSARIGPGPLTGELCRLERAVDRMADALARDFDSRRKAEEALRTSHEDMEGQVRARTQELSRANSHLTQEIAVRARMEETLRQSEEKHRALYEQAAEGILIMDAGWKIIDANPAALALLGYRREDIVGLAYPDLIHPDSLAAVPFEGDAVTRGSARRVERLFRTNSGGVLPADVSARRVSDDIIQAIISDATERKNLEQLKEDVDRIARHDLKAPLAAVAQLPALLLKADNLTARQREMVAMIREASLRMLRMVNMSLSLYRMETNTYRLEPADFDLLRTTRQVLRDSAGAFEKKEVPVRLLLDGGEAPPDARVMVRGEKSLCVTMLENLVANALEASPRGEAVILEWSGRARVLSIANAGEVPPEIRGRFFEKYATAGKKWGTGLGTYSARLIARTCGWAISLDASVPGRTRIDIAFPQADQPPADL